MDAYTGIRVNSFAVNVGYLGGWWYSQN